MPFARRIAFFAAQYTLARTICEEPPPVGDKTIQRCFCSKIYVVELQKHTAALVYASMKCNSAAKSACIAFVAGSLFLRKY